MDSIHTDNRDHDIRSWISSTGPFRAVLRFKNEKDSWRIWAAGKTSGPGCQLPPIMPSLLYIIIKSLADVKEEQQGAGREGKARRRQIKEINRKAQGAIRQRAQLWPADNDLSFYTRQMSTWQHHKYGPSWLCVSVCLFFIIKTFTDGKSNTSTSASSLRKLLILQLLREHDRNILTVKVCRVCRCSWRVLSCKFWLQSKYSDCGGCICWGEKAVQLFFFFS